MEGAPLVGTYKRYKAGTSKLVQWLHDSAPSRKQTTGGARSKRIARPPPSKKVTTDELLLFAQAIVVATNPRIEIPVEILDVAKDTITGRRKCAAWYAGTPSADVESNKTHMYFLGILEQVFKILRIEHKKRQPKRKKRVELVTDVNDLSNLYRHLELEDPTIDQDTSGNHASPVPAQPSPKDQLVELETNPVDDMRFAVWCFLSDLQEIRQESRETWLAHRMGEISFVAACKVTDKAADLVDSALVSLVEEYPKFDGYEDIIDLMGRADCVYGSRGRGHTICTSPDRTHDGPSPKCFPDMLMLEAWSTLYDLEDLIAWLKEGHKVTPDLRPVVVHPRHPFAKALFNVTADLMAMVQNRRDHGELLAYVDVPSAHLLWLAQGGTTFSAAQVFAVQAYMDMYDILDGNLEQGLHELSAAYRIAQDSVKDFVQLRDRMAWPLPSKDSMLCPMAKPPQLDGRDGWLLDSSDAHRIGRVNSSFGIQFLPSNVLATLPILCGKIAFDIVPDWQTCGVHLADLHFTVMATAHLYKAAVVQVPSTSLWSDMETAIAHQTSPEETPSEDPSRVSQLEEVLSPQGSFHFFAMAEMYASWNPVARQIVNKPLGTFFYECIRRYTRLGGQLQDNTLLEQWNKTGRLTNRQLLRVVRQITAADEPGLNFDYVKLVGQCHQVIIAITLKYGAKWGSKIPAHLKTEYPQPNLFINEILWEAAGIETRGLDVESTVLHALGIEIQKIISASDDASTRMANELSSGYARYLQAREISSPAPLAFNDKYPSRQIIEHRFTNHIVPLSELSPLMVSVMARACIRFHEPFFARPWNLKKVKEALCGIQKMIQDEAMEMGLRYMCHLTLDERLRPELVVFTQDEMDRYLSDGKKYLRDLSCGFRFLKEGEEELRYVKLR